MLKYFYANINYAGKIQRVEDQLILNSIVSDLFTERVTQCQELPQELNMSHYGFPIEGADYFRYLENHFPGDDHYEIFGFNWNIESGRLKQDMFGILGEIFFLGQNPIDGMAHPKQDVLKTSIEMNSLKTSLRSSNSQSGNIIEGMLSQQGSLLNFFISLQKLLSTSSLDSEASEGRRYDHNIDQEVLPQRDLHDKKVVEIAMKLLDELNKQFDDEGVIKKFPIRYKAPINNVINRELTAYSILLKVIRESVADLLANIDGKYPRPFEIEALWSKI
mmetsp:Transcript_42571/g.65287  ORF Transcript_42571/g.65287 Transcript_42571/m.65287 type:complete len:276 (-) Transcript_42571:764-1591(-)